MRPPRHIAIIMDGNGRWASARGRDRSLGHLKGAKTARRIIEECARLNVEYLTLYAFSSENWFRPVTEVNFLMHLLRRHLMRERSTLMENNVRFYCIGELDRLPKPVQKEVSQTIQTTRYNTGMNLTCALSYGSRQEITQAAVSLARRVAEGTLRPEDIDANLFSSFLDSSYMPDPDLIIRTSGESRLSNFLLWQAAYSEILITDTYWPDFSVSDLHRAIDEYHRRERRFGRTTVVGEEEVPLISTLEASP